MKAYWFSRKGTSLFYTSYEVRPEPYVEDAETIVVGRKGLHASVEPFDARQIRYDATTLDLVELGGVIKTAPYRNPDKHVASERTHLARMDATDLLIKFNLWCALQVTHLWGCPAFVKEFLEEGTPTEELRAFFRETRHALAHNHAYLAAYYAVCLPVCLGASDNALKAIRFQHPPNGKEARIAEQAQRDKFLELVTEAFAKVGVTV